MEIHGEADVKIDGIQEAFEKSSSSFTCSGSMTWPPPSQLPRPFNIYYETSNDGHMHNIRLPCSEDAKLQELIRACEEDKASDALSCSKSYTLNAKKAAFSLDIGQTGILHLVQRILAPESEYIIAEPYTLNVHEQDGFSKAHKDVAPRPVAGDDVFGYLLVSLPQSYTGGDLLVRSPCDSNVCRYPPLSSIKQEFSLHWVALASECGHEVERVTSGTRITLTFNLFKSKSSMIPQELEPPIDGDLFKAVGRLASGTDFNGILGFPLEHMYVPGSSFKGRDLVVYNTLTRLAKEVRTSSHPDEEGRSSPKIKVEKMLVSKAEKTFWENDDDYRTIKKYMYIEWDRFKDGKECYGCDGDEYEDEYLADEYGAQKLRVKWVKKPNKKHFFYNDRVPMFGNDIETRDFYCAGCLLVHVK
jgi:hypothetical protein